MMLPGSLPHSVFGRVSAQHSALWVCIAFEADSLMWRLASVAVALLLDEG